MELAPQKVKEKITGLLALFRFELPLFAGVNVVVGQIMALGAAPPISEAVLGFASVFLISATALIRNDYFDLETDRINAPERPLPSGKVMPHEALILSILVTLLGLAASVLVSIPAFITTLLVWVVGVFYNWRFKRSRILGNSWSASLLG